MRLFCSVRFKLAPFLALATFFASFAALGQPAAAEVLFKQDFKYFTVRGKNTVQIFKDFQRRSPIKAKGENDATLGVATIQFTPEVQYVTKNGRCRVGTATVTADVTIHLPRWANYKGASEVNQRRWDRFVADIKDHELTHAAIARKYADRIQRKIESFLSRPDCETLENALAQAALSLLEKHDREQRAFDEREYRRLFGGT